MITTGAVAMLVLAVVAGPTAAAAWAADGGVDLAARMLQTSDLPSDFQPYEPLTGPLNAQRGKQIGGAAFGQFVGLLHGWVRWWVSGVTQQQVIEAVYDLGTSRDAREASDGFVSAASDQGATRRRLAAHLDGYLTRGPVNGKAYVAISTPLARGPFLFTIAVVSPASSSSANASLLAELAAVQERKVPAGAPDTGTSLSAVQPNTLQAAGAVAGSVVIYLAIVSGIAYLRDPLRRWRWHRGERPTGGPVQQDGQHVLDVSKRACVYRNTARLRLVVQFTGLIIIAGGADPYLVPQWYIWVPFGAAVTWAGGRGIRPAGLAPGGSRSLLSGTRRVRVTALMSLALVLVIASAVVLIAHGLNLSEPAALQAAESPGGSTSAGFHDEDQWFGIALMCAGAILARHARRLAAVDAHRLMQRDTRPPVLYLRSFGDDALKLWTATFGRPSLLERFTPYRFDAFEEVIARHLSLTGPVIALNPSGTSLAPLGAARETLDSADWQSAISEWMSRSAVIVFVMPPGQVTSGLHWEIQHVSAHQYWTKTLIIIPPVRASLLQARWHRFLAACSTAWPFTIPLPTTVPKTLTLTFRNDTWTAVRASRRDEWTYSAAIQEALNGLPLPAATNQDETDPRRGNPSGTTS